MIEVSYTKTFEEKGEKFGAALITCSCGWVKKVRDSLEDFEAHIKTAIEEHQKEHK